jgi:hypothetical protein
VQGHSDFVIKTLLYGLTGPNNGRDYTEVMIPMGSQNDEWIASVASFVRTSFGNAASFVTPADVARVRAATAGRKTSWTVAEIESSLPVLVQTEPTWKTSASAAADRAANGLTLVGWNSGGPAAAGMWYQVELPEAITVAEVQYNAPAAFGFGRGGRGGRGAAAAPAPPPAPAARGTRAAAPELQIAVSLDGQKWSAPLAGTAGGTLTTFAFQPTRAKFIRITRTAPAQNNAAWTIQNLRVYRAATPAR